MKALMGFLTELCRATKVQLSTYSKADMPTNCLHLYRLGDVLMRCMRSQRPLLHLMTAWSVVAPYLVEVSVFCFFLLFFLLLNHHSGINLIFQTKYIAGVYIMKIGLES